MSKTAIKGEEYLFICEYCGTRVRRAERNCPALDDGRCEP